MLYLSRLWHEREMDILRQHQLHSVLSAELHREKLSPCLLPWSCQDKETLKDVMELLWFVKLTAHRDGEANWAPVCSVFLLQVWASPRTGTPGGKGGLGKHALLAAACSAGRWCLDNLHRCVHLSHSAMCPGRSCHHVRLKNYWLDVFLQTHLATICKVKACPCSSCFQKTVPPLQGCQCPPPQPQLSHRYSLVAVKVGSHCLGKDKKVPLQCGKNFTKWTSYSGCSTLYQAVR